MTNKTNNYHLSYIIKPDKEYIAAELGKIFRQLNAFTWDVITRYETIINKDWSHTKGKIWRHEAHGMWHFKDSALKAKIIIDRWLGGDDK